MKDLKKWEIALLVAVLVTLLSGALCAPGGAWWCVVYPELTPGEAGGVMTAAAGAENGVELRFHALEWLETALQALGFSQAIAP